MTPKRKRPQPKGDSLEHKSIVYKPTTAPILHNDGPHTPPIADSPRSKVARHFESLDIHARTSLSPSPTPSVRKSLSRKRARRDIGAVGLNINHVIPLPGPRSAAEEVAETPGAHTRNRFPSSPPLSPERGGNLQVENDTQSRLALPRTPLQSPTKALSGASGMTNVSPIPLAKADLALAGLRPTSSPASDSSSNSGGDARTLTWQDSEITGHEIDMGGDDDGEGVNGIGFKPTAAMAEARSAKRRQQVCEWRAREAREERKRRFEKRRRENAVVDGEEGDRVVDRKVRFACG